MTKKVTYNSVTNKSSKITSFYNLSFVEYSDIVFFTMQFIIGEDFVNGDVLFTMPTTAPSNDMHLLGGCSSGAFAFRVAKGSKNVIAESVPIIGKTSNWCFMTAIYPVR